MAGFFVFGRFSGMCGKHPGANAYPMKSPPYAFAARLYTNVHLTKTDRRRHPFLIFATMSEAIVNKVAESGLITLDLEQYYPKGEIVVFDLKDYLFMGLILKEKDFRAAMQGFDWSSYQGKSVAVHCSADAVIPMWAYMLVASYLQPVANEVVFGNADDLRRQVLLRNIQQIDMNEFADKRIVVKGCGDQPVGEFAYMEITNRLRPIAKSIMYGEPCSTVPIFKKK